MYTSIFFTFFALFVSGSVSSPVGAEIVYKSIGQELDLIYELFLELVLPIMYNTTGEDPLTFKDFTYDMTDLFRLGEANISNSKLSGVSDSQRLLTVNVERQEIGIRLYYPEVAFSGDYSLNFTDGSSKYHEGLGEYRHTFWGVTLEALYKLDNSTDFDPNFASIRYTPLKFDLIIEYGSLYAENYFVDGQLQLDWGQYTQLWMENYVNNEDQKRQNNILFGEATALALTYIARAYGKSSEKIFQEFIGFGAEFIP